MKILGVDPGSRITGYGIIEIKKNKMYYLSSGCIIADNSRFYHRLQTIYRGITEISTQFKIDFCAIEKVFFAKNADSALKLGQARGAAIVALANAQLELFEYSPTQIKHSVVGHGRATKKQIQYMVCKLLHLSTAPATDAADALACAICHHYQHYSWLSHITKS